MGTKLVCFCDRCGTENVPVKRISASLFDGPTMCEPFYDFCFDCLLFELQRLLHMATSEQSKYYNDLI